MAAYFPLGVGQLWDELQQMQTSGLYWTHVDQHPDVSLWCQQVIAAQAIDSQAALVTVGISAHELLASLEDAGPKRVPLFSLPANSQALHHLPSDLNRALKPGRQLLLLVVSARTWQEQMKEGATRLWLADMAAWLQQRQSCLLVVSYGSGSEALRAQLQQEHRNLLGLARLRWQQDSHRYQVAFWCNQQGVSANQQLTLGAMAQGWQVAVTDQAPPQSNHDEYKILSQHCVLQGGVAPTEHWQLFADNKALLEAGLAAQTATIVFALQYNRDIEAVASKLHQLRRHCGQGIKLIVREVGVSLRQADERLLLACGANIVVSHHVPLARFLVLLDAIQGQRFVRHVPADITPLLDALMPLQLKGVLKAEPFCAAISELMTHPMLTADAKGVLVALQPVPSLKAAQALTLCQLHRMGDVVTVTDNTLFLFLFSCSINDVNLALRHVFQLPVVDLFLQQQAWHQDLHILAELQKIKLQRPNNWLPPQLLAKQQAPQMVNEAASLAEPARREPHAISLPLFLEP